MNSISYYENQIRTCPLFQKLPSNALEYFESCFDLEIEAVSKNKMTQTNQRIGYLLEGEAFLVSQNSKIQKNDLFGIKLSPSDKNDFLLQPVFFQTKTDCIILWLNYHKLKFVCYACCWFHINLLQQIPFHLKQKTQHFI